MPATPRPNLQILLRKRPTGLPTVDDFELRTTPAPEPAEGQVLLRTLFLSLDPYMRGRMSDAPSYAPPVAVGDVMVGATVSRVEASRNPGFKEGDLVLANLGWQAYALSDGKGLMRLDARMPRPSLALGVLGMPGFTAYMGLLDIGAPKPGETVVVAGAAGAVGAVVGQIAKLKGCRAVGLAGGAEKCQYVKEELGFDECIDHKETDLAQALAVACPDGIDVYFENVGGRVSEAVFPLLNTKARVPVCGLSSSYNATSLPAGPDRTPLLTGAILRKRLKVQGFIIFDDYGPRFPEFLKEMTAWVTAGRIKFKEDVVVGLERAPEAFIGLLQGKSFGKLVVQAADR